MIRHTKRTNWQCTELSAHIMHCTRWLQHRGMKDDGNLLPARCMHARTDGNDETWPESRHIIKRRISILQLNFISSPSSSNSDCSFLLRNCLSVQNRGVTIHIFNGSESRTGITIGLKIWLCIRIHVQNHNTSYVLRFYFLLDQRFRIRIRNNH